MPVAPAAERWQRVKTILAEALECETAVDRTALLERSCHGDQTLLKEVEDLLARRGANLDECADQSPLSLARDDSHQLIGTKIGAYEMIRELGRGGMGTVWLARRADQQFEKLVAIKLLKRGTDTDEVLRRFYAERQILARLEHPNIARLLDGGITDDDLPYFVMEYVEGRPVTEFCRDQALTIEQRLQLFLKICRAVQFAHQNLVVHRDLKPGNILVPSDGEPKLLDFGIAKLLAPESATLELTLAEHQRLTPAYASPEQVRGEPITTVSDVYALGAVLYEMLTGTSAHRFSVPNPPPTELLRVVTHIEPVRPSAATNDSSIARHLRGDLDNIVLKALRKESARRYSGASAFAEDIRRYLNDRPVTARKSTVAYRASKFIQRNKIGAASAGLILLALLGGIIATTRQARIASAERARAERRFNDVRNLADSLLSEINNEAEKLSGSTALRSILVQRTLGYLDRIATDAGDNRGLQRELATAYQKVGEIQGNTYYSNLGDTSGAIASYEKAVAIREQLSKATPQSAEDRHELALAHEGYADVLWVADRLSDTLLQYRQAESILKALISTSSDKEVRVDLSRIYHKIGDLYGNVNYSNLGDTAAAVASDRESLRLRQALAKEEPSNKHYLDVLSESYLNIGVMQRVIGDLTDAIQNYRNAIAVQEQFRAAEPDNPIFRRHIAFIERHLAIALQENGNPDEAEQTQRASVQIAEEQAAADTKNIQAKRALAISQYWLGYLLARRGAIDQAIACYENAIAILDNLFSQNPSNAEMRQDLFEAYLGLGDSYTVAHNSSAAMQSYTKARTALEPLSADTHNRQASSDLAALSLSLSRWERDYGSASAALQNSRQAVSIRKSLLSGNSSNAVMRRDLALAYAELGAVHEKLGTDESRHAAEESYKKALALWQDMERTGTLANAYASKPAELAKKIADCTERLHP